MPLHILIADDSATNRMLFSATVTRMGHQADVVATGREAIDLFAQNSYDLVFLDINMPGIDGITTAKEIHALNKRHTPVYAVSGWIDADTEEQITAAAIRDCLIKPLDREKLTGVITACGLENQAAAAPQVQPPDIPKKLLAVYADELRARADACERHYAAADIDGVMREAHTLRALADMLRTPDVERTARIMENQCQQYLEKPFEPEQVQRVYYEALQDMTRACYLAARTIERLI